MKIKKMSSLLLLLFFLFLLVGCDSNISKTQYNINEKAYIDDIAIKLMSVTKTETNNVELVFEIENNRDNTITITADNNFKLFDNNIILFNLYNNNQNIIKSKEKIYYTLQYNIINKKEYYDILFYSGIVENNIKFTFYIN